MGRGRSVRRARRGGWREAAPFAPGTSARYLCLRQSANQATYRCEAEGKPGHELTEDRDALLMKANEQFIRLSAHNLSLNTWV